jgi:hypothetical protein
MYKLSADPNKSKCPVIDEKSCRQCGHWTAGKNPTNLKSHLSIARAMIAADELKEYIGTRQMDNKLKKEKQAENK